MNDLTSNIVFVLLSTCPGFLIQKILIELNEISYPEISDYDKGIWAFFYSFLVLVLNYGVCKFLRNPIYSISQIISNLDSFEFIIKYVFLTGFSSVIVAVFIWRVMILVFTYKKSQVKKRSNSILHSELTVWDDIIRGNIELIPNMSDMCIEILKNGQVITQGILHCYINSKSTRKDFLLTDVEAVRGYIDNDQSLSDIGKMFPKILCEYYDSETDVLIRIYDNENVVKNFGEQNEKTQPETPIKRLLSFFRRNRD